MAGGVRKQRGRWYGLWHENGIKKSKVLGLCSEMTKTAARDAVAEIVRDVRANANTALFGPFVEGPFYNFYERKWKGSTKSTNENRMDVHLVKRFRDCSLETFRREQLQDFLDEKAKTLSYSMVTHLRWDLRQIFAMAQAEGLVRRNPAQLLFTPKKAAEKVAMVLTAAQIQRVIGCLAPREALITELAIFAGMRPGEIFALRRANVADQWVEVRERVYQGVLDSPKSERGFRKVALPGRACEHLHEWLKGVAPQSQAFVFASERATPLSKNNIWRRNMLPHLNPLECFEKMDNPSEGLS